MRGCGGFKPRVGWPDSVLLKSLSFFPFPSYMFFVFFDEMEEDSIREVVSKDLVN